MSLALPQGVARRVRQGRTHNGPAASAFFGRSVRLLEAADELERTAHEPREDRAFLDSLRCLTAAFESLATATVQLSLVARKLAGSQTDGTEQPWAAADDRDGADAVTYMMFAASQNLRIAAETAKQAQRSLLATRVGTRR